MQYRDLYFVSVFIALVVASFAVTARVISRRARELDEVAVQISENSAPSVLYLSAARTEVRRLQADLRPYLEQASHGQDPSHKGIDVQLAHIHEDVQRYLVLPVFPAERALHGGVERVLAELERSTQAFLDLVAQHRLPEAGTLRSGALLDALERLASALTACLEFNAQRSRALAVQISRMRTSSLHSGLVLSALCVIWPVAVALLFVYGLRRQVTTREEQRRLALERAEELEQFAGRIAHDIRNPLSTINLVMHALDLAATPERRTEMLTRGKAGVARVQQILDGLLKFACAGAQPEPGAHSDGREVLAGLERELRVQAAAAGIDVQIVPVTQAMVACSPGILISLIQNLTENAIKYIGDGAERRITVRMVEQPQLLRFEVEDTGPGLPPGAEEAIFNPHVRVRGSTQPGFGLGLATVKKAVEAHRGRVGVRSEVGRGCLFWFELPRVAPLAQPGQGREARTAP